jgi:membrane peptidoglycan carboxypeptidase
MGLSSQSKGRSFFSLPSPSRRTAYTHHRSQRSNRNYRYANRGPLTSKKTPWGTKKSQLSPIMRKRMSKVFGIILGVVILATIGGTIVLGATLASISTSLPNPDELVDRQSDQSTKIFDRGGPENGVLLYTIYGDQNREFVSIDKIPLHTIWAFLAAEDAEFYEHKGLDLPGLAKAAYNYVFLHQSSRGASTISQQLVKNTLLYDLLGDEAFDKTLTRKAKEMLITMQLEQTFTKNEILQMYLNEVALGGTNYGIEAGAKAYFGKDVSELTLSESALLAGLVQTPGITSPLYGTNPELALDRQHYVLDQMLDKKDLIARVSRKNGEELKITEDIIKDAKAEPLVYNSAPVNINAPHFVFYVKQQLIDEYGIDRVERGGLRVTTTLDYDLQTIAEEEVRAGVDRFRAAYNVNNASMIVIDPKTGQILSMVGSYDYWAAPDPRVDGNVNITTQLRQMGSSVKPYTYLSVIHKGYSPALLTPDIPLNFGAAYKPKNWDGKYQGLMLARQALVESRNLPALYTLQLAGGAEEFVRTAEAFGISSLTNTDQYGLSITLGAAEMSLIEHTAAFATFANNGVKAPLTPILKVETSDGKVLQEWGPGEERRVWDEKEIYLLNWMLCDLDGQGRIFPQYYAVGSQKLCGKTGTTDGPKDLTAFLYYPNLAVGVWTGNNNNDVTIGAAGQGWSTTVPLPIANSFFSRVLNKFGNAWYTTRPAGIVGGTVCRDTGLIATESTPCEKVGSVFIQGNVPRVDDAHVKKPICKETGKVATNEADANAMGLIDYKTYLKIKLENTAQQASIDKWLSESPVYSSVSSIPEEAECPLHLGPGNAPTVHFTSPIVGQTFTPGSTVHLKVETNALHPIEKIEYFLDDTLIGTVTSSPYSLDTVIPSGSTDGNHSFLARATDTEGLTSQTEVVIVVHATDLSFAVSIPSIDPGSPIAAGTQIRVVISGSYSVVDRVIFSLELKSNTSQGREFTATKSSPPTTWRRTLTEADLNGLPSGQYTLYATAYDDNTGSSSSSNITVSI